MEKGEAVRGYIDNGKLQVDLLGPAVFTIKNGSPLDKWLRTGNEGQSPPQDVLQAELVAHKAGHHCEDIPCLAMRRLQTMLRAMSRNEALEASVHNGSLTVQIR